TNGDKGIDDEVSQHFGRAATYTILDDVSDTVDVIPNTSEHMGGTGHPPEILASQGIEVLLCQGLGRRAIQMFDDAGISVYIGAQGTVAEALKQYHDNVLALASEDNACSQHAFRDPMHGKKDCKKKDH
ncbi:NifB/NifX family molybdenum-iron cluster-binding protein, partial [Candidatus Altiarchaeota archaeon]